MILYTSSYEEYVKSMHRALERYLPMDAKPNIIIGLHKIELTIDETWGKVPANHHFANMIVKAFQFGWSQALDV